MSVTPEGAVKRAVKKELAKTKLWYFMPVQNGLGRVGIPDFVGCVPYVVRPQDVGKTLGLFFARETKAPGKMHELTANQQREVDGIRAAAGNVKIIDDARQLCLPVSTYDQVNETQAAVSEGLQRAPGDCETARGKQCGEARAHPRREGQGGRREGCRAPHASRSPRLKPAQQPGGPIT